MSHNFTVESGSSVRLLTAGKYCEQDIVVTATGGAEDLNAVLNRQETLIAQLQQALEGKAGGGGGFDNSVNAFLEDTLEEIDCDGVTEILQYVFYQKQGLKRVKLANAETIGNYNFQSCGALEYVDLPAVQSFGNYCFRYTTALTTLILRYSGGVVARGSSVLAGSGIANKNGYIYVPAALVDSYKSATGWSTYSSQFRAIEDYPEITGG